MAYNQTEIRDKLLQIYSSNKLEDINDELIAKTFSPEISKEEVQKTIEALTCEHIYLNNKILLSDFKVAIERELNNEGVLNTEQELKAILFEVVLNRAISFAYDNDTDKYNYKMQLLYDLIHITFIKSGLWDQRLATHFDFVFPILKDWYSFFFSYTNKEAFDINKRYETILHLGSISSASNQVARFVAEKLCKESLPKAFIDEKEIEYGSNFKDAIDTAIEKSYTFVQIISNESFLKIGKTNWCQYEIEKYNAFLENTKTNNGYYYENVLKKNIFFLIMGYDLPTLKPAYLISEYRPWYSQIESTHYIKFYTAEKNRTINDKNETIDEIKQDYSGFLLTIKRLSIAIIQAKKRLIDAIPA
ncbi:MAG: hypothetical protein JWN78_1538 [Bacteroidota bacterium]|nr:hypothetical protein [Bacteroidota bacterium]